MRAAVWHGRRDVRIEQVAEPPQPGPGEVQLKVGWCGICGTDLHEYAAGPIFTQVNTPHPLSGRLAPLPPGHEFAGTVVAVGAGVTVIGAGPIGICAIQAALKNCSPIKSRTSRF